MSVNVECELKEKLKCSLKILRKYEWLLNSYVLDFYVDNHWQKLPGWRNQLDKLEDLAKLNDLLDSESLERQNVWPLSLLALKELLKTLCIPRETSKNSLPRCPLMDHPKMCNIFTKCVKPKKRHEIQQMAGVCQRSCGDTAVDFVVDFGAGLGHLARVLGYGFGIRVCCLEMQHTLNEQARVIDMQLETMATKHLSANDRAGFQRPTHVTLKLSSSMTSQEFLDTLKVALNLQTDEFRFGIIGLHPCGDLGAILMRMFLQCGQAKFLNFVGCCYMKLTTPQTHPASNQRHGYPLSGFLLQQCPATDSRLSYEMCEISCHAIEMYRERLASGQFEYLKIHSFRAAAERVLIKHSAEYRHLGLRSVSHTSGMEFEDYFYRAIKGLSLDDIPKTALLDPTVIDDLLHWKRVVVFYTLRLMLAPLVESVILYDRMLYVLENDCQVSINAIFDARLSPRNHVMSAVKRR